MKSQQDVFSETVKRSVRETVRQICASNFDCQLEVDALIGITISKKEVLLVKINEVIQGTEQTTSRPNSRQYQDSPVEFTEDHADDLSINVPSKRHFAQTHITHSPKRRKPEEEQDDSEPQDLSQRTHSPVKLDFANADSNSRDSPAKVVRIPSTESNSSNSQWKGPDHMEQEDNGQAHDDMDVVTMNLANQNMAEYPSQAAATATGSQPATQAIVSQSQSTDKGVLVPVTNTNVAQKCYDCTKLLAKLEKSRKELLDYHRKHDFYTAGENPKPRPGCIPPTVAEFYKMQAFVSGSGVFVYPDVYRKLMVELRNKMAKDSKPPASWLAIELFSMFHNKEEYKPPAIEPVEPHVRDAIITLAIKEGTGNRSTVSAALDNQIKQIRDEMDKARLLPGQPIPIPVMIPAPQPQARPRQRHPARPPAPTPAPAPTCNPQSLQGIRLNAVGAVGSSSSAPSSPPGRRREIESSIWAPTARNRDSGWGTRSLDNNDSPTDQQPPSQRDPRDPSYYSGEPGYVDQRWRGGGHSGGPSAGHSAGHSSGLGRSAWSSSSRGGSPGPISRPQPPASANPNLRGRGYRESTDRYWRC